jgi:hypothetical protein
VGGYVFVGARHCRALRRQEGVDIPRFFHIIDRMQSPIRDRMTFRRDDVIRRLVFMHRWYILSETLHRNVSTKATTKSKAACVTATFATNRNRQGCVSADQTYRPQARPEFYTLRNTSTCHISVELEYASSNPRRCMSSLSFFQSCQKGWNFHLKNLANAM